MTDFQNNGRNDASTDDWLSPRTVRAHYLQIAAQAEAEKADSLFPDNSLFPDHAPLQRPRTWAERATVRACALLLLVEVLAIGTFILIQLANLNG